MDDDPLKEKKEAFSKALKEQEGKEYTVRLESKIARKLDSYCRNTNFSVSALVQIALEEYLEGII